MSGISEASAASDERDGARGVPRAVCFAVVMMMLKDEWQPRLAATFVKRYVAAAARHYQYRQ